MEAVYSTTRQTLKRGQKFQNPRFFTGVLEGARGAKIHGDYPEIVDAYKLAGLDVEVIGARTAPKATPEVPASAKAAITAADQRRNERTDEAKA